MLKSSGLWSVTCQAFLTHWSSTILFCHCSLRYTWIVFCMITGLIWHKMHCGWRGSCWVHWSSFCLWFIFTISLGVYSRIISYSNWFGDIFTLIQRIISSNIFLLLNQILLDVSHCLIELTQFTAHTFIPISNCLLILIYTLWAAHY